MQHLGGNLLSRWTRFLETDGEKPDRNRDQEFESKPNLTRRELMETWERGWSRCLESLDSLTPEDLSKTIRIRGEEHTVPQAIQRQIAHSAYHVGQIVLLAKHLASARWKSLSIPKGGSEGVKGTYRKA
jgi:D-tyrosyl-tRNA(Tyr) deacylase